MTKWTATALLGISFVALFAFRWEWRVISQQKDTIAELRWKLHQQAPLSTFATIEREENQVDSATNGQKPTSTPSLVPIAMVTNHDASIKGLQEMDKRPEPELQDIEATSAASRKTYPELEKSDQVYFGPGTWLASNPAAAITRVQISGAREGMTIKVWGRCSPRDCEWEDRSLFLLNFHDAPRYTLRQGFAGWDHENFTHYLIVTFEKTGLRVETIAISTNPNISNYGDFQMMTRLY